MIKAIETEYKGYRFRSRLEARWAVFFDAVGISWEYEPEGFVLPSGTWYLPDFCIWPKNQSDPWLFEVKPIPPYNAPKEVWDKYRKSIAPALELDNYTPEPYWGVTISPRLEEVHPDWVEMETGQWFDNNAYLMGMYGLTYEEYNHGIRAAKSARFEHGEKPTF